jgi:DNA-directed RNA polymerase subunit RPC12/RpoP
MRNALTKSSKVALSPAKPSTQEPNKAPFEEGEMPRVYDRDEPLTVDKVDNDADKPVEFEDIVPDNQGLMAELAEAGISEYQEAEWHLRQREEPIHALMEDFYHQPQQGAKGRPSDDLYRSGEANLEQRQTAQQHEQPPELDEIAPQKGEQGDEGADSGSSISAQDQVGPQGESQPPRQSTDLSEIWPVMVKCAHCGEISKAPEPGNYACPYCDSEFIVSESGKLFFQVETDESL